jgi:hypothetical protein
MTRLAVIPGALAVGLAAVLLSGCAAATDAVAPDSTSAATSPGTEADAGAGTHAGAASTDRQRFDAAARPVAVAQRNAGTVEGAPFIDALADAGFPVADVQVTPDATSVGLDVAAVSFSVRAGDACLIGQFGAEIPYGSTEAPPLPDGTCLLGETRAIDWR